MTMQAANEGRARPGSTCAWVGCHMPAVRRIAIRKPGWSVAEDRDVCDEHFKTVVDAGAQEKKLDVLAKTTHVAPLMQRSETARDGAQPTASAVERPAACVWVTKAGVRCTKTERLVRGLCPTHYAEASDQGVRDEIALPPRPLTSKRAWKPSERHERVLGAIKAHPGIAPGHVAAMLSIEPRLCKRLIFELRAHGLVEKPTDHSYGHAYAAGHGTTSATTAPPAPEVPPMDDFNTLAALSQRHLKKLEKLEAAGSSDYSQLRELWDCPSSSATYTAVSVLKKLGVIEKDSSDAKLYRVSELGRHALMELPRKPTRQPRAAKSTPEIPAGRGRNRFVPRAQPEGLLSEELVGTSNGDGDGEGTPAFVVRLGAMRVECASAAQVIELHRALGAGHA